MILANYVYPFTLISALEYPGKELSIKVNPISLLLEDHYYSGVPNIPLCKDAVSS